MTRQARRLARQLIPKRPLIAAWAAYSRRKARRAAVAFAAAGVTPAWLGWDELEALQAEYPLEPSTYRYDLAGLEQVGRQRLREMLAPVRGEAAGLRRFLDLGMWDGTVCHLLQQSGKVACGIDIRVEGLTEPARAGGALFAGMDAAALGFRDEWFDFAFSYNSFEHFPDPERALLEAWRVVRPGGYIYLNFGPIYYTPKGAHQFNAISAPYCECLFPKELLAAYAEAKGIVLTEFFWMNEWRLTQYRELWRRLSDRLEPVIYHEIYNADHVELITRYPSCFKSKTPVFEDLIVSNIEVLFRKQPADRA